MELSEARRSNVSELSRGFQNLIEASRNLLKTPPAESPNSSQDNPVTNLRRLCDTLPQKPR
jgi:hypothetical protein